MNYQEFYKFQETFSPFHMAVLAVSYSGSEITGGLNEAPLTVDLVSKSEKNRSRTFRDIEVQRFGFEDQLDATQQSDLIWVLPMCYIRRRIQASPG